jgi:hypothetical protein
MPLSISFLFQKHSGITSFISGACDIWKILSSAKHTTCEIKKAYTHTTGVSIKEILQTHLTWRAKSIKIMSHVTFAGAHNFGPEKKAHTYTNRFQQRPCALTQ